MGINLSDSRYSYPSVYGVNQAAFVSITAAFLFIPDNKKSSPPKRTKNRGTTFIYSKINKLPFTL